MAAISNAPIILDMGSVKRRRVRQLKKGRGRMVQDVHDALADVSAELGSDGDGKQIVPIVLVYRKKRKKAKGALPIPFLF